VGGAGTPSSRRHTSRLGNSGYDPGVTAPLGHEPRAGGGAMVRGRARGRSELRLGALDARGQVGAAEERESFDVHTGNRPFTRGNRYTCPPMCNALTPRETKRPSPIPQEDNRCPIPSHLSTTPRLPRARPVPSNTPARIRSGRSPKVSPIPPDTRASTSSE